MLQLGGAAGRTDAAVRADARACSSVLHMSSDSGIPLTFVEELMRFESGPPAEEPE